jgi:hypothetical protein
MQEAHPAQTTEKPAGAGLSSYGRGGFRTCDLSRVNQSTRAIESSRNAGTSAKRAEAGVSATPRSFQGISLNLVRRTASPAQIRVQRCSRPRTGREDADM